MYTTVKKKYQHGHTHRFAHQFGHTHTHRHATHHFCKNCTRAGCTCFGNHNECATVSCDRCRVSGVGCSLVAQNKKHERRHERKKREKARATSSASSNSPVGPAGDWQSGQTAQHVKRVKHVKHVKHAQSDAHSEWIVSLACERQSFRLRDA